MNGQRLYSKMLGTIAAAALMLAHSATAQDLPVTDKIPTAMTPIRVMVYNGAYTSLPVQVAKDLGFYRKYNLDAELIVVNSGPAGVAALLGGSIDFIEPPTDQIMENVVKGTDLRIVVGNEVRNFYKIIVNTNVALPNASKGYPAVMQDLKGLRIGVNALGATTHLMSNALFRGAGIDPASITYVADGSANTALAAWQAGRIDAQMAFTPFPEITQALGNGRSAIDMSRGEGPAVLQKLGGAFEAFSAKGSYIREHPDVVNAFIKAHIDSITWIKDPKNRTKLTEEIGKFVNTSVIPADKREQTLGFMIDNYSTFFGYTVDRSAIDAWNEYLLDNKLIPKALSASEVIYAGAPKP
ncbi:MAG TPA: ABC transporter substrate-binding protein [Casimicrobiaceae bacterium]|nr:ABC transporter substrate-binding protein [Casimicrobiaceae bacterium]